VYSTKPHLVHSATEVDNRWQQTNHFSHFVFFPKYIVVICPIIVVKITITVFTTQYFWSLWPNWLKFFSHFKKISIYDGKKLLGSLHTHVTKSHFSLHTRDKSHFSLHTHVTNHISHFTHMWQITFSIHTHVTNHISHFTHMWQITFRTSHTCDKSHFSLHTRDKSHFLLHTHVTNYISHFTHMWQITFLTSHTCDKSHFSLHTHMTNHISHFTHMWQITFLTSHTYDKSHFSLHTHTKNHISHFTHIWQITFLTSHTYDKSHFSLHTRAWPISFFWADTDVFQFSLPISDADTNIFVILKQYLFCLMRQNNHS